MLGPNLIEMQDMLKRLSDSDLAVAAQTPGAPQFLAVAEMTERARMRQAYAKEAGKSANMTVAERLSQGATNSSVAGNVAAANAAPQGMAAAAPVQGYAEGGLVRGYANGGPVQRAAPVTVMGQRQEAVPLPTLDQYMAAQMPYLDGISTMATDAAQRIRAAQGPDRIAPRLEALAAQEARDQEALRRDKWMALAQAGLAAAAGQSPNFLSNVVTGANAGLGALSGAFDRGAARDTARTARSDTLENLRMQAEQTLAGQLATLYGRQFDAESAGTREAVGRAVTGQEGEFGRNAQAAINAADNIAAMQRARLQESGATGRTAMQIQAQERQDAARLLRARAEAAPTLYADIEKRVTNGEITPDQARAERAAVQQWTLGRDEPSTARSITEPTDGAGGLSAAAGPARSAAAFGLSPKRAQEIFEFVAAGRDIRTLPEAEQLYARMLIQNAAEGTGRQ